MLELKLNSDLNWSKIECLLALKVHELMKLLPAKMDFKQKMNKSFMKINKAKCAYIRKLHG